MTDRGARITVALAPLIEGLPNPIEAHEAHINIGPVAMSGPDEKDRFLALVLRGAEELWHREGASIWESVVNG